MKLMNGSIKINLKFKSNMEQQEQKIEHLSRNMTNKVILVCKRSGKGVIKKNCHKQRQKGTTMYELNFWNVHGITNTSCLLKIK